MFSHRLPQLIDIRAASRATLVKLALRSLAAVLAAAVVLPLLAACSSSTAITARDGDRLEVLCTVEEGWCKVMVAAFESKTGIATTFDRLGSGDAVDALHNSKANPKYSVWWGGSADGYVAAKADGVLAPYKSPNASAVPNPSHDVDGAWTRDYVGPLGYCSNQRVLARLALNPRRAGPGLLNPG